MRHRALRLKIVLLAGAALAACQPPSPGPDMADDGAINVTPAMSDLTMNELTSDDLTMNANVSNDVAPFDMVPPPVRMPARMNYRGRPAPPPTAQPPDPDIVKPARRPPRR